MFKNKDVYVIAEVGQNHQGDIDTALEYIKIFSSAGADAIKFQSRNNKYLFSKEAYDADYNSENAFAKTYGAHREHLELSSKEIKTLISECKKFDVDFMSTPFDEPSLELLVDLGRQLLGVLEALDQIAILGDVALSRG